MIALLHDIAKGNVSPIYGSRKIIMLQNKLNMDDIDDFVIFENIDSDTDHLPFYNERINYTDEVLKKIDVEISRYEEAVKEDIRKVCYELIKNITT